MKTATELLEFIESDEIAVFPSAIEFCNRFARWNGEEFIEYLREYLLNSLVMGSEIKKLQEEVKRYSDRDGNATIELNYEAKDGYPWNRETLKICDFGVSDNIYVVESKMVQSWIEDQKEKKNE